MNTTTIRSQPATESDTWAQPSTDAVTDLAMTAATTRENAFCQGITRTTTGTDL